MATSSFDPALDVTLASLGTLDLPRGACIEARITSYNGNPPRLRIITREKSGFRRPVATVPLDARVAEFIAEQIASALRIAPTLKPH